MVAEPALVAVELMYIMFSTPLIWSSSGAMTEFNTVWALAPWLTYTVGGAMSGYCSTGSVKSEISPITRISTDMEIAITGRFINIFPFILMGH